MPWIGELDPKRFAEMGHGGKWMLFYDQSELWTHWKKCQQLYRNSQLEGVSNMKVSTSHPHHAASVGVIILYCGPPEDEQSVIQIGATILKETLYSHPSKKLFYKTDTQTLEKGKGGYHRFELDIPPSNMIATPPVPPPAPGRAPMAPVASNAPIAPMAPMAQSNAPVPRAPAIKKKKKEYTKHDRYLAKIKGLGFERVVIIGRNTFDMLSASHQRLDGKKIWKQRIKQQSVLNGRQKLVVLNWFRKEILQQENRFKFQKNWDFPGYILNIITLHYLENIDDKQQLIDDWTDSYKPCFYFYQQKWNILLREGTTNGDYQSLVCLKGKECLIAKQCMAVWIIAKVRIMAKRQMRNRYQWMSYQFSSAPQAYSAISEVFDVIEEAEYDS
eukprot:288324_1